MKSSFMFMSKKKSTKFWTAAMKLDGHVYLYNDMRLMATDYRRYILTGSAMLLEYQEAGRWKEYDHCAEAKKDYLWIYGSQIRNPLTFENLSVKDGWHNFNEFISVLKTFKDDILIF